MCRQSYTLDDKQLVRRHRVGSGATPLLRENARALQVYIALQLLIAVLVRLGNEAGQYYEPDGHSLSFCYQRLQASHACAQSPWVASCFVCRRITFFVVKCR